MRETMNELKTRLSKKEQKLDRISNSITNHDYTDSGELSRFTRELKETASTIEKIEQEMTKLHHRMQEEEGE